MFLARISMEERNAVLFDTRLRCEEEEEINCAILMFIGRKLQDKIVRIGVAGLKIHTWILSKLCESLLTIDVCSSVVRITGNLIDHIHKQNID